MSGFCQDFRAQIKWNGIYMHKYLASKQHRQFYRMRLKENTCIDTI